MAAKYLHYTYDQLNTFCMDAFQKFGFSESEARIISDVLLLSDLYGIESHGMQRLVRYHKGIEKGMIDVHAKPEIVHETPVSAVIDAHDAMGQLVSHQAMELAIAKAKKVGMAIVSVRNSNHFGIAGYYAKMACDQGLVGMAMTNSEAIMVPTYARMAMIGSNPIALAGPAEPYPFFFEASTTVVTRGKLEVYNKMGKPLPEGWALDKDGNPTTDPAEGRKGMLTPFGGPKGSGIAIMIDIASGILSGGGFGNHLTGLYEMTGPQGVGHFMGAIDVSHFTDLETFKEKVSEMSAEIKALKKAPGVQEILMPGDLEANKRAANEANGIEVEEPVYQELLKLGKPYGLSL